MNLYKNALVLFYDLVFQRWKSLQGNQVVSRTSKLGYFSLNLQLTCWPSPHWCLNWFSEKHPDFLMIISLVGWSGLLITLIKCLKCQKCLGLIFGGGFQFAVFVS